MLAQKQLMMNECTGNIKTEEKRKKEGKLGSLCVIRHSASPYYHLTKHTL